VLDTDRRETLKIHNLLHQTESGGDHGLGGGESRKSSEDIDDPEKRTIRVSGDGRLKDIVYDRITIPS
jgi:hypothetical protein